MIAFNTLFHSCQLIACRKCSVFGQGYRIYLNTIGFLPVSKGWRHRNKADVHHIVHRSEGGFDIELNYKYLCAYHHRGKNGPHQNQFVDLQYKIEMQNKLYNTLQKEYYSPKEISQILGIHNNSLKRLLKNLKRYKEGYKRDDIIYTLMGCVKYSIETLEELALDRLTEVL